MHAAFVTNTINQIDFLLFKMSFYRWSNGKNDGIIITLHQDPKMFYSTHFA